MESYVDSKLTLKYGMPPIRGKIDFNPSWMSGYKAFLLKLEATVKVAFGK